MFEFLILGWCVLFVPLNLLLLKGTFLEASWKRKGFGGLVLGKEVFLLIIPGVILYSFGVYKNFTYFYVTDESVQEATIYALYALLLFSITFAAVCKFFYRHKSLLAKAAPVLVDKDFILIDRIYRVTILCIIAVLALFLAGGMRHALLSNIVSGNDLMEVRLQNRYATSIPTVIMSFFRFLFVFNGILFGLAYDRLSKYRKIFGLCLVLFAVTFFGDKAPIFSVLILMILANLSIANKFSFGKIIKYSLIMGGVSLVALFAVSYIQFGGINFSDFIQFLIFRAGLGQIGGLYEQFAVRLYDPNYIWHSIPFANLVVDYPIYNKDLMMMLWGANVAADETGVVNSFFVGEAFAIGGYVLALISPAIVALNYCVAIVLLTGFFRYFFGYSFGAARIILQLLIPSTFIMTGDIAGILFGKLLVMTLLFLLALWLLCRLLFRRRIFDSALSEAT
ncbi:hypothetical protein J2W37_000723 [Variovorax paradoxus]|uniref:hypothetical protein n=1 Tax=Variovorax paradoxus TaxID=34073 RepID=UPI0027865DF8|nr:hypothetical protein [Variovorax paradoxus]MDP9963017.1 hypothetical protein [Variovorax paradoxus]